VVVTISNPVFLTLYGWAVHYKFFSGLIIGDGGFHLYSIVSVSKLGKAETTHSVESIDIFEVFLVTSGA
jgi:hypothetical protein